MTTYTASFTATAASAHYTARLCYRKGRRDTARVARLAHSIATHPRTVEAAKVAVWCLYLGAVASYALGQTVRIYAQHWVDGQVSASLPAEVAPVAAEITVDPFCPTVNPLPVTGRSRVACSHCDGGRVGVNGAYTCPKCHGRKTIMAIAAPALEGMTIRQLKAQAKAAKVPNYGRMTKTQLVEALRAA